MSYLSSTFTAKQMHTNYLLQGLHINCEREWPQSTVNVQERVSLDGNWCHSVIYTTLSQVPFQSSPSPGLGKGHCHPGQKHHNLHTYLKSSHFQTSNSFSLLYQTVYLQFTLKIYVLFMYMSVLPVHVYVHCLQRSEKDVRSSRTGLQAVMSCNVGAGN